MSRRQLPLLDIRTWRSHPRAFAEDLRRACHRVGFFTLRHDLPARLPKQVFKEARKFFDSPSEIKHTIDYTSSPAFRGYMANGVENTAGRPDLREQVEIATEGPASSPGVWPPYKRL